MNTKVRTPYIVALSFVLGVVCGLMLKAAKADCTAFVGMSQTWNTCSRMGRQGGDDFACIIASGMEIEDWANNTAWRKAKVKADHCNGSPWDAEHVAIQLSAPDPSRNTREHVESLSAQVVQQVRSRFDHVQDITLITSTGGPNGVLCPVTNSMRNSRSCVRVGGTCYVRSSHQYNSENWLGMVDYANTDAAVSVYTSQVCNCNNYSDGKGHLNGKGKRCTADRWITAFLEDGPQDPPDDPPEDPPNDCPVPGDGETQYYACFTGLGFTKPFTHDERMQIRACVRRCN